MFYDIGQCGNRIRQLRRQNRYTQEELAVTLGVDRSVLSRIESGKYACPVDFLARVSSFFDVSLDYLVFGTVQNKNAAQLKASIVKLMQQLEQFKDEI